jgi:acyl-CoA reductase-like NAD-dependent aldehyde dehydrogenase
MTASEQIKQQLRPGKLFINGGWEDAAAGRTIDVVNPATGELLTTVPDGQGGDENRAVAAARASFELKSWRGMESRAPSPALVSSNNLRY